MFFPHDLIFVDAARYADAARNFLENGQFITKFIFPSNTIPNEIGWIYDTPPLHIASIALFFKFFGVNDLSVILESTFFFLAGVPLVFLLARKIFNKQIALFSALFYILSPQLLNYAKDGASEPIFIFELLLIAYLLVLGRIWSLLLVGVVIGLSFFTKLQSYLFMPIFLLWALLLYRKELRKIGIIIAGPLVALLLNKTGILFGNYQSNLPLYLAFQQTNLFPGDDLPRSGKVAEISFTFILQNVKLIFSKIFYHLYNFYKSVFTFDNLLPQWTSPVMVISYIFSQINFLKEEERDKRIFRVIVLLMVGGSFLLASATSPSVRYAHFVLPFVIILAVDFIYSFLQNYKFSARQVSLILTSILLVFMVLPTLGATILDSRFNGRNYNIDKPYAHKVLGQKIGELSGSDDIIVTNLDTWGSWYGKRKTVMMPIDFTVLQDLDETSRVTVIFLTDFQKDNEDHPVKGEWGELFDHPEIVKDKFILENFRLVDVATVSAQEVYENKPFTYRLWLRTN